MTNSDRLDAVESPAEIARIVKRAAPATKPQFAPAGEYRVIHGNVMVPRFSLPEDAKAAKENGQPTQEIARMGDVVYLTAEDATRMLASDIVEPLDAKPSRVDKVWTPPKPVRNKNLGALGGHAPTK